MNSTQIQDSMCLSSARTIYRSVRAAYRGVRAVKNRLANRIDPPVVVLVYHRVTDLRSDPEMIAVTPENFSRQVEFLQQHFRILRFEDDWSNLREPAVAITFDDGYADNLLEALPILENFRVPATFFVSTGQIGTGREFWWHRLETLLLQEGDFPPCFSLADSRYGRTWETANFEQRKQLYAALSLRLREFDSERREDWLGQLESWAGARPGDGHHRCMTPEEVKQLSASRWATIGAHTVTHSALSALAESQQRKEIWSSKQCLEEITGREITTFSYPFGRRCEYNRTSIRLCREAGFTKVAANFPGQVHKWTDPLQIPRHLVRNWDLATFSREMQGFWTR